MKVCILVINILRRKKHSQLLQKKHPDSALNLLKTELKQLDKSAEQKEKFQKILLFTELSFQNYRSVTNDSLMLLVVHYYDSVFINDSIHKNKISIENQFIRAKAHLLLGNIYQSNYLYLKAMQHYLTVLKILDQYFYTQPDSKTYQLRGTVYDNIGSMFFELDFYEYSKDAYGKSLLNNLLSNDSASIAKSYWAVGTINFFINEELDTFLFHLHKGCSFINEKDHPYEMALLLGGFASCQKDFDSCVYLFKKAIQIIPSQSNKKQSIYKSLAYAYYDQKMNDSALKYALMSFESDDFLNNHGAAWGLSEIYNNIGDHQKSNYYSKIQKNLFDDFFNIKRACSGIQGLYNDYEKNKNREVDVVPKSNLFFYVIFGVVLFLIITIIFYQLIKKRKKELILSTNLQQHKIQLSQECWNKFRATDIYDIVIHRCPKDKNITAENVVYYKNNLSVSEMEQFQETLDLIFNNFTKKFRQKYHNLSDIELEYCYLSILNLSEIQKAALLNISYQGVVSRRNRAIEKIGQEKFELKKNNLGDFLKDFLNECL